MRGAVSELVRDGLIEVVPRFVYELMDPVERRSAVPRDLANWAPVALASTLDVVMLSGDNHDFLNCGCPAWTADALTAELNNDD
ncbi:MAG TPA: hypothetical protein VNG12_14765 [Acidimicrobiales bacterium]|nr:hypothetical protein [Acidimicrobiales bacterium]